MKTVNLALVFALLAGGLPRLANAVELQPDTLKAWDEYVRNADSRLQARLDGQQAFLWTDEESDRSLRLRRGEILVAPVSGRGTQSVANGLIHDWIGATFIPDATIKDLLAVVHDYDRYKEFYKPVVAESKVLACSETDQRFSMVWQHRILFINASVEGQYQARDFAVDERRGYNIANTSEIREIEAYRQNGEHLLPPGQGNGFIWRLHSIARFEERDGGVYLELEAIVLSRDIPASLRRMVSPVVNHLSINSLTTSLRQTRDAIESRARTPERVASCTPSSHKQGNGQLAGGE